VFDTLEITQGFVRKGWRGTHTANNLVGAEKEAFEMFVAYATFC